MDISNVRQNEILGNVLDWFSEHYEQEKLLDILHNNISNLKDINEGQSRLL